MSHQVFKRKMETLKPVAGVLSHITPNKYCLSVFKSLYENYSFLYYPTRRKNTAVCVFIAEETISSVFIGQRRQKVSNVSTGCCILLYICFAVSVQRYYIGVEAGVNIHNIINILLLKAA